MKSKLYLSIIIMGALPLLYCSSTKNTLSPTDLWISQNLQWNKLNDSTFFTSTYLIYFNNDSLYGMNVDFTRITGNDSLYYTPEPGFFLTKANIYKTNKDTLFLRYKVIDERMIKLPDTDTFVHNRTYYDYIILKGSKSLIYNNTQYTKEEQISNKGRNQILGYIFK